MTNDLRIRQLRHGDRRHRANAREILRAAAIGVGFVATFALGLTMGENTERSKQRRESVAVWVGTGCDDEGQGADFAIVAHDLKAVPWPCKVYEKQHLALIDNNQEH